jgi:hypothetical protein
MNEEIKSPVELKHRRVARNKDKKASLFKQN